MNKTGNIFDDLKTHATPYSVVRFGYSLFDGAVEYQILVDYSKAEAARLAVLGFRRERLTAFRNRYMWRPLTGRELARFLEARYSPVYQDGENMIWNFLGGVKKKLSKTDV